MKRLSPDEIAERLAQRSGIAKPINGRTRRGRANLRPIITWHDPVVRQQLKLLGVEMGKTKQKLMQEALNLLFAKHGKPQIA